MISYKNDYCGIAHPLVLKEYEKYSKEIFTGYSTDRMCEMARKKISDYFDLKNSMVEFCVGGTSCNKIVIAHALKPYEAVLCCESGHINVHETGAIEETGHKVVTVPSYDGKLRAADIEDRVLEHTGFHMVAIKMVYISYSTEYGTLYTLEEIKEIRKVCDKYNLYLYLDGARLGSGLASKANELNPCDFEKYFDVFYVGGTKNGLPIGEAVVICNDDIKKDFMYSVKHYGGLLAKGFLLGIGFNALFENNLFLEIGAYENELAQKLQEGLKELGLKLKNESPTNQIFPIVSKELCAKLEEYFNFDICSVGENEIEIRFATSFMNTMDDINQTLDIISKLI